MYKKFSHKKLKRRDCLGNLSVDGRIISKQIIKKLDVDWIQLAQWQCVVYIIVNLQVPSWL
jgi:hypothetical protein